MYLRVTQLVKWVYLLDKISVAVNNNDILHRFFNENDYSKQSVCETISPSMDISVASNFERLIYDFF